MNKRPLLASVCLALPLVLVLLIIDYALFKFGAHFLWAVLSNFVIGLIVSYFGVPRYMTWWNKLWETK